MPDTITDRFNKKQSQINQLQDEAVARYPSLWSKMIAEWNQPGMDDRAWLMYAANYLFRTNNVRWAMDPLALSWRIKDAPKVDVARDLGGLSFALLTHRHNDHLDIDLLSALRHMPITWVVPKFILTEVVELAGLPRKNIIIPTPLEPIELNGIRILPFDGSHWETTPDGNLKGVPATGYLIEFNGRRWIFPGDTRTYDASQLPSTAPVDGLFAHLWLGRGCALMDDPPLLDAFCRFCLDLQPSRVIITHLNEFGRDADDFWDEEHAEKMCSRIRDFSWGISANSALMGESVLL